MPFCINLISLYPVPFLAASINIRYLFPARAKTFVCLWQISSAIHQQDSRMDTLPQELIDHVSFFLDCDNIRQTLSFPETFNLQLEGTREPSSGPAGRTFSSLCSVQYISAIGKLLRSWPYGRSLGCHMLLDRWRYVPSSCGQRKRCGLAFRSCEYWNGRSSCKSKSKGIEYASLGDFAFHYPPGERRSPLAISGGKSATGALVWTCVAISRHLTVWSMGTIS